MAPTDVFSWSKSCNDIVIGSKRIDFMLNDPSFIQPLRKRLIGMLGDKPDYYAMISQMTLVLLNHKFFEKIIIKETKIEFVRGGEYSWFCFWCSIVIYKNIVNLLNK